MSKIKTLIENNIADIKSGNIDYQSREQYFDEAVIAIDKHIDTLDHNEVATLLIDSITYWVNESLNTDILANNLLQDYFFKILEEFNSDEFSIIVRNHFLSQITQKLLVHNEKTKEVNTLFKTIPLFNDDVLYAIDQGNMGTHALSQVYHYLYQYRHEGFRETQAPQSLINELIGRAHHQTDSPVIQKCLAKLFEQIIHTTSLQFRFDEIDIRQKCYLMLCMTKQDMQIPESYINRFNYLKSDKSRDAMQSLLQRQFSTDSGKNTATELFSEGKDFNVLHYEYFMPTYHPLTKPFPGDNDGHTMNTTNFFIEVFKACDVDQLSNPEKNKVFNLSCIMMKKAFSYENINTKISPQVINQVLQLINTSFEQSTMMGNGLMQAYLQLPIIHRSWRKVVQAAQKHGWKWTDEAPLSDNSTFLEIAMDHLQDQSVEGYANQLRTELEKQFKKLAKTPDKKVAVLSTLQAL